MNHNISSAIILEEHTPAKDGAFPVKIRLTRFRKQRYYGSAFYLSKDDFKK
jgi:hypothetical protein